MKCVMVMFDTLCKHLLSAYGCDWTHTPNFKRLAQRSVKFDRAYVCSMPCMPARRELHTGRPNFLHRSWGPLEPFDDSMPSMLKQSGVYSHLITDHYHYFEDGGGTYHPRYTTWEFFRGQEGDPWFGQVKDPTIPPCVAPRPKHNTLWRQDWINRSQMPREEDMPQSKCFRAGVEFMERNREMDRWFLQIETFDPHEPFFSHPKYKELFAEHYAKYGGKHFDWPPYSRLNGITPEENEHLRFEYASLLAMCDAKLGDILDTFDRLDLWKDTMLIVNTDHGFLLGEHDMLGKVWCPFYNEVANMPLFIWDPRSQKAGESRQSLVQTIDLAPTILEFFGVDRTADMTGKVLRDSIATDKPVRETAIFGAHGGTVNITDGRYVYMRARNETNTPLIDYTLMPCTMSSHFKLDKMRQTIGLAEPFGFTKGVRTVKYDITTPNWASSDPECAKHLLFDLESDPQQLSPLNEPSVEARLIEQLKREMHAIEAPPEQYTRLML
jgi:arylsulfatase A-like enzyme